MKTYDDHVHYKKKILAKYDIMANMKESNIQKKCRSKPRLVGVNKKLAWIYRNDLVAAKSRFSCERSTKNGCQLDEACKVPTSNNLP